MSAFEKLLHKDNKKLNRLQHMARNYISTGSYNGNNEGSRMSAGSAARLSSAVSQGSLNADIGLGGGSTTNSAAGRIGRLKSAK